MSLTLEQAAPKTEPSFHEESEAVSRDLPADYWEGELVPPNDPRAAFISVNPERLGGTACFVGTRVPVKSLWDYLVHDAALPEFLDDFEGVPRAEVLQALRYAFAKLMDGLPDGRNGR